MDKVQVEFTLTREGYQKIRRDIEKQYLKWALNQCDKNVSRLAKMIGIDKSTVYRKLDQYEISNKPDYTFGVNS